MVLTTRFTFAKLCTFIAHPKVYHGFSCFTCLDHVLQNARYWLCLCLISTELLTLLTLSNEGSTRIKIEAHFFLQLTEVCLGSLFLRESNHDFAVC